MFISINRLYILLIFFFFFQAEDGIRDYKVTGVQTCALPILFYLEFCFPNRSSAHLSDKCCLFTDIPENASSYDGIKLIDPDMEPDGYQRQYKP